MSRTFPLPSVSLADLRGLYEQPERIAQGLNAETLERALSLARVVLGASWVALHLEGAAPLGDAEALGAAGQAGDALLAPSARPKVNTLSPAGRAVLRLSVPLLPSAQGVSRLFGVLVASPVAQERWPQAEECAAHVATILTLGALARAASADPLTGLLTRASLERLIPRVTQAIRDGRRVALLLLDVDRLREVNAAHGLRAGDELLRVVASAVKGAAEGGLACRYGGDELALLLWDLSPQEAVALADELVAGIAAIRADRADRTGLGGGLGGVLGGELAGISPSISVGVACGPEQGATGEELVIRSGQALLAAKARGGGRSELWSEALRQGTGADRLAGILTGDSARDYRHVDALLQAVESVLAMRPLSETLDQIVDHLVEISGAQRGLLLLASEEGWVVRVARGADGHALSLVDCSFAASVADAAAAEGRVLYRLAHEGEISVSANALGVTSVLCAPLSGPDLPSGVVYVDASVARARFDRATIAFFGALTAKVGIALRSALLRERLEERARSLEVNVARQQRDLARLERLWAPTASGGYEGLIGASPAMEEVFSLMRRLEESEVAVLILGESGTGKELVARALHARSPRRGKPFVAESCASIAESLFERELFGHVRGAYTGAHADQPGLLELANGGTVFLDEIGELPLAAQAKLLRVLQEGELRRVGDTKVRQVDFRLVTATHRDLRAMVEAKTFREDLFYRLAVFRIPLPRLRERPSDIPLLTAHLLEQLRARGVVCQELTPAARQALVQRRWRGNVRELGNVLERAATLAAGEPIGPEHIEPEQIGEQGERGDAAGDPAREGWFEDLVALPLREAKVAFSALYARRLVEEEDTLSAAARRAGASRQTIYRLLEGGSSEPE